MKLRTVLPLAIVASIMASLGCSVSEPDIVGEWAIMVESRGNMPEQYRSAQGKIQLTADRRFTAWELLGEFRVETSSPELMQWREAIVSGSGSWELGRSGDQVVRLRFLTSDQEHEEHVPFVLHLFVVPGLRGLRLVYFRGDPDNVDGRVYFSRVKTFRP